MNANLFFWSEFLDLESLKQVIPSLGSHKVGLNLAITPRRLSRIGSVVKECEKNGILLQENNTNNSNKSKRL